ncbi:ABC transporter permease [Microbacterium mitrae]|uniref:ABC transporter permease n=1 Tax=Microbacterium mitrae TaxID=664640 RepID=A0A5C8HSM2_9MICO|nr:ABC transporter permease [Microbacterium mitrae]TXK06138.1 ABC transporter permease [Microbacterium mitrae]
MTSAEMSTIVEPRTVVVRSLKNPIVMTVVALALSALVVLVPRHDVANFCVQVLCSGGEGIIPIPAGPVSIASALVMLAIAAYSFALANKGKKMPLWLTALYIFALVFSFATWASAGKMLTVVPLLAGALALAIPLVLGALGGVIGERAGVVNIAIEAQLLGGAFTAAAVGTMTGSPWWGLVAAVVAGALIGLVLAVFAITYYVNQVIVGVVLNVLIAGLTTFLVKAWLDPAGLNAPPLLPRVKVPLLGDIPIIGPVFFDQSVLVYIMYVIVFAVSFAMFRTRWGLRLRAVGEHPQAADTVGIKVARTRYLNVMMAGGIAGIGGAYYTLVVNPEFGENITAGAGFIALAAVIFGKWDPIKATLAALLFGFATNLQSQLSVMNSGVPSQFLAMVPYLLTIFVVAGLVGRARPPAASGQPYIKN